MSRPRLADHATQLARRLLGARPAAVALDFDGTLTEIVDDPRAPRLTSERRAALAAVAALPGLRVAILSGRARADAAERVGVSGVEVVGNHGLEMEGWAPPGLDLTRPALERFLAQLEEPGDDLPPIEVEDKGTTATVHLRAERTPAERDRLLGLLQRRLERTGTTTFPALRVHPGKSSVEVRPALEWDKARALLALLERWQVPPARALYAGDDVTDECVFKALRDGITIRVGQGETAAAYVAEGPEEVYDLLTCLASLASRASD